MKDDNTYNTFTSGIRKLLKRFSVQNLCEKNRQKIICEYEKKVKILSPEDIDVTLHDEQLEDIERIERLYSTASLWEKIKFNLKLYWLLIPSDSRLNVGLLITNLALSAFFSINGSFMFFLKNLTFNSLFFLGIIIVSLFTDADKRVFPKSCVFYISLVLTALLAVPYIPKLCGYKTTQIGDFYEGREYTETYYVYYSKQDESVKDRKIYTLPAEISRIEDCVGYTREHYDYWGEYQGGEEIYALNYRINYLYFPNGGYLYFEDNNVLILDKECRVRARNEDDCFITLTNRTANKSK